MIARGSDDMNCCFSLQNVSLHFSILHIQPYLCYDLFLVEFNGIPLFLLS